MELTDLTVLQALDQMRAGAISSEDLTRAYLDRIDRLDKGLVQAYVTVIPEAALAMAREADRRRRAGEDAPLLGVPMALKDLVLTRDIRTTCSSKMLEAFVPVEDATIAKKLYAAGAVLLGKTNMDEFAMGSSTENSAFFPTRNPWGDLDRVPGGSSGGSAAAVAARLAPFSIGSDTGGSIRQPASLCGVVGFKPTYGRVSRYGLIAFASSLDQLGPLSADVADCALVTEVIAGHDPRDSTSLDAPVPRYLDALDAHADQGLRGVRLGVPKEYFVAGMEPGVERAVQAALDVLRGLGAEIGEVSLPHTDYGLAAYYIIAPAECSANLARYDGVRYGYSAPDATSMWDGYYKTRGRGFGPEVKRRIMLGTYALSSGYYDAYYLKAQKIRTLIKQDFDRAFERYDALVAPTSPTVAFRLGERTDDPLAMYLSDVCTIPVNLAGLPGLSLPCGLSDDLPVGLQVIGKALGEETVFKVAHAYERARGGAFPRPELSATPS
ncbi:MAG: Asp-tRNA(Asn)/Glu-tRNA(Gln) amidotransferase subunit GatA [Chloroflexi bacterium]|nr:Asp-tRNA(Asn)/Glu-tRNA(Gln) amidotransferase subunit GatA [Chloroflexota bacterium]